MVAGPLTARIAALCDQVGPQLGPAAGGQLAQLRRQLREPLRVAVAGRLKAGKSTLVNALIGRRVAPTAVGECTRVVTQLRHGPGDRVEVVRRDGTRTSLPLDESGMIPQRLGVPLPEVGFVDVTLASDHLRDLTIVDTPGLSSTHPQVGAGVRDYLFGPEPATAPVGADLDPDSAGALAGADAIAYVFSQAVRADDAAALAGFRAASARLASNPVNSLGLLTRVDTLAGPAGADPWPVAGALAAEQARLLRGVVADVVPVAGLLAETTQAGRLTPADCEALRALAGLPEPERLVLLASVDLFTTRECPVPAPARERLLRLLDRYGVGLALAELAARPRLSPGELVQQLAASSGLARLRHTLDRTFRDRTDTIKAARALATLAGIAARADHPGDRELLRDATEAVLREPAYHRLRTLEAARLVTAGAVELPEPMAVELARLATSTDPAWILDLPGGTTGQRLAAAAVAAAGRWRAYAVGRAGPAQSRVAMVGHRGFHLLARQLRDGS